MVHARTLISVTNKMLDTRYHMAYLCACAHTGAITIQAPQANTKVRQGETLSIKWKSVGAAAVDSAVEIHLMNKRGLFGLLGDSKELTIASVRLCCDTLRASSCHTCESLTLNTNGINW